MTLEESIEKKIFGGSQEKTFIEKILAKSDVDRSRKLISKDDLTRSDLMELLNLLSGNEIKLLNYDDWDRYVMAKYFIWIREFVSVYELILDYEADLKERQLTITRRARYMLNNIKRNIQHWIKILVDLYFNLIRSSLSIGAAGFKEVLTNKYEVSYPNVSGLGQQVQHQKVNSGGSQT